MQDPKNVRGKRPLICGQHLHALEIVPLHSLDLPFWMGARDASVRKLHDAKALRYQTRRLFCLPPTVTCDAGHNALDCPMDPPTLHQSEDDHADESGDGGQNNCLDIHEALNPPGLPPQA